MRRRFNQYFCNYLKYILISIIFNSILYSNHLSITVILFRTPKREKPERREKSAKSAADKKDHIKKPMNAFML
jgi:hypothetical protein